MFRRYMFILNWLTYIYFQGEKKFIYAETWTDEELGIPPDDADDPE